MKIKVNIPDNSFTYECAIFPRIGESIIHEKNVYVVKDIYHHVNKENTVIEVDAEYRFKMH